VPQEAYVIAGTLRENLTYHRGPTDHALLDAAADAVGLTPLLARLGGYDSEVVPDTLSAGERQLVALARAYLSPAPIAILDEATCHLDPAAEARVEQAFARRPGTLIVVAHRISSALRARRIMVIDGQRIHLGDHQSLLVDSPLYGELVGHWNTPTEDVGVFRVSAPTGPPTGSHCGEPPSSGGSAGLVAVHDVPR
jgi:ATP-binding cassette subfamily C protein